MIKKESKYIKKIIHDLSLLREFPREPIVQQGNKQPDF
jgi:hypothetical protein